MSTQQNQWRSVSYGNGLFMVVAQNWDNNTFVAVYASGDNRVMRSEEIE